MRKNQKRTVRSDCATGAPKRKTRQDRGRVERLQKFLKQNIAQGGELPKAKKRGARLPHERLLYYINVNRTSLDHLLLGVGADVDKSVE